MIDYSLHDDAMPKGWHTIKSVLLTEMHTAANFHLCCLAADALFHARLVGEGCAKKNDTDARANPQSEAQGVLNQAADRLDEMNRDDREGRGVEMREVE